MKDAAIPSTLRRINRRLILRHMVKVPLAARGELAAVARTSAVTAGRIVDELMNEGVLEPVETRREERAAARPGRPGQSLRLNMKDPRFLLVQLGVERTRLAFVPLGVAEDAPWTLEFETPRSEEAWETAVAQAVKELNVTQAWGILMSVPGMVDEDIGRVLFSPNLHWSEGVDFREMLRKMVDAPVEMVHEIRALALGHLSASPAETDFLLVDFGHGVGGAGVIQGGLQPSALPMAGELGHAPILGNPRVCGCGAVGCLETLVSRDGLFASMQEAQGKTRGKYAWPVLREYLGTHGAEPWLRTSLAAAGATIGTALNVLGLARAVITGSIADVPGEAQAFLADEVKRSALWGKFGDVHVAFAPRRRMRGLVGVGIDRLLVGAAE